VNATPTIGDKTSLSNKSKSSENNACRNEKPGRNKTNKILTVSERADTPPTRNKTKTRNKPATTSANFEN